MFALKTLDLVSICFPAVGSRVGFGIFRSEKKKSLVAAHETYACCSRIGASVNRLTSKIIFTPPTTHETLVVCVILVFYLFGVFFLFVWCRGTCGIFRVQMGKKQKNRNEEISEIEHIEWEMYQRKI